MLHCGLKTLHCICCTVGCWGSYSANETAICDIVFQDTIPPWWHHSLMTSFLDDIIPWWHHSWLWHHSFLIKISHCLCCTVDWKHYIAYVALLVAEAVTVQMRQQYVILCFKIPFLLDDIIPWRHHPFLIKLSDCICCAVGCWGSYSANETAICDIVFQDTIPPWWHHSLKTSFLLD